MTLSTMLQRAAHSTAGVTIAGKRFSYSTIADRAARAARFLVQQGIRPGDCVGIVLPTSVAFYDAFFGCILAGAIPAPLYPPMRLGRLDDYHARTATMLGTIEARLVITDTRVVKLLGETLARAKPPLGVLTAIEHDAQQQPRRCGCEDDAVVRRLPVISDDDVAFVQFSSGTTNMPKPVPLTHRQILANVDAILTAIRAAYPHDEHKAVSWLPLYHDMGLIGCVLGAMVYPGDLTLLAPESFVTDPAQWLRAISETRSTISAAPNFAYALCADRVRDDDIHGIDLSCWRVALNGAEPVAPRIAERFIERFAPYGFAPQSMTPVYGLAEATVGVTFGQLAEPHRATLFDAQMLARVGRVVVSATGDNSIRLVNLGKPLASVDVQISDAAGEPLPEDVLGRILIRGPSVTSGYLGEPRRAAEAWLDSGDTGFIHDGGLYVYGRTKDIIVVRGRKYAPHDVEHALADLPGLRAGCVVAVGLPGSDGEELAVFAEHGRSGVIDEKELRARVLAATGLTVARIVVLAPGTLPRTSSGKLSRSETRRRFLAGDLRPPKRVGVVALALAMLRSRLALRNVT